MATPLDLEAHARVMAEDLLGAGAQVTTLRLADADGNVVALAVARGPRGCWVELDMPGEDRAMERLRERLTKAYRMAAART